MEKLPINSHLNLIFSSLPHSYYFFIGAAFVIGIILLYTLIQAVLFYLNIHKKLFIASFQFPVIGKDDIDISIEHMSAIFSSLHGNILSPLDKLFIEILRVDKYITIQIGSNKEQILEECKRMFSQLEGVRFTNVSDDVLTKFRKYIAKSMYTSIDFLPVGRSNYFYDGIINYLSSLADGKHAGIQFILRGVNKKFSIERRIILLENKINREKRRISPTEQYLLDGYRQKLSGNLFRVKINIFGTTKTDVTTLKSFFQSLNLQRNNWYSYPVWFFFFLKNRVIAQESFFDLIPQLREQNGSYLTSGELSSMIHPSNTQPSRYQPEQNKQLEATPEFIEKREDNIQIGTVKTIEQEKQPIYFPLKNFNTHAYLIGKTGRGKSSVLFSLISNLHKKKAGNIILLDPHGELSKDLITHLPHDKLVYLPLSADLESTFSFNILYGRGLTEYEKVAIRDMLLDILKSETDAEAGSATTGTATMNRIKTAIEIGLEFADVYFDYLTNVKKLSKKKAEELVKKRQLTLNDLPYIYIKEMKYADLLEEIFENQNTELSRYIEKSLNNHVNQIPVAEAVQSRLKQLLHPSIALIAEGNKLSYDEIIKSDKTYLIPIPEDIYGSRGQKAILKMFLSMLWQEKRKVPALSRKNTYIFLDEMQRAQISIIPTIIAEARKYKLYLILANQQLGQLTAEIRDSIAGNMGTIIAFTLGAGAIGAELMAKVFGKRVTEEDLINLPTHNAYLQTEDENNNTLARFTFQTLKIEEKQLSPILEGKLTEKSLKEFGESKQDLRERLNKKQENPLKYFTDGI